MEWEALLGGCALLVAAQQRLSSALLGTPQQ
jgi:hypothetical protein